MRRRRRLATGKIFTLAGRDHPLLSKCVACDGKGMLLTWVDVHQFVEMLHAIEIEEKILPSMQQDAALKMDELLTPIEVTDNLKAIKDHVALYN